jgi:hypothetical protein
LLDGIVEGLEQKAGVRLLEVHLNIQESETLADNLQLVDTSRYKIIPRVISST